MFNEIYSNDIFWKILNFLSIFFLRSWHVHQIFNIFEKKMTLVAEILPKLLTAKSMVTLIPKKPHIKTVMEGQHV